MSRTSLILAAALSTSLAVAPSPKPTVSPAPTTHAPTLRPTVSPAPTQACICDQRLVLTLKTDSYPGETAWTFKMTDPRPGCVDSTTESDKYTQRNKDHVETISTQICAGQGYAFEITDSWDDGICCGFGHGSYVLELDGKEVASGGSFGRAEKTSFVAPRPPRPTAQPRPRRRSSSRRAACGSPGAVTKTRTTSSA